jgi:hypothetical protein
MPAFVQVISFHAIPVPYFLKAYLLELLLALLSSQTSCESASALVLRDTDSTANNSTDAFLSSKLTFTKDARGQNICLLNAGEDEIGVMMGWEQGIMEETVHALCQNHAQSARGLKVLNIGFGLGIVSYFLGCMG